MQSSPPAPEDRLDVSLGDVRSQMAIVRSILDELERSTMSDGSRIHGQLVEELARLGCRVIDAAATASRLVEPDEGDDAEGSGVHERALLGA
jgi:hypothetical protein